MWKQTTGKISRPLIIFLLGFTGPLALAQVTNYTSPNGVIEECRALPQVPGGDYKKKDTKKEQELCSIDFYDSTRVAICPKTWSTSPGTMLYDITQSQKNQQEYEDQPSCGGSKSGHESLGKFKQTMNQSGTSGTYSPSSLLYYHFSRYFDTNVGVPVAVYRTMDKDVHFSRVTKKAHENSMGKGKMNKAGWKWLYDSEKNPRTYRPTSELFTDDEKQIYGMVSKGPGKRYGAEINGIRSGWGDGQNHDFQNTPAFLALRSEKPFAGAVQQGLAVGLKDAKIKKDMGADPSEFQMALWMKELSEIALLDHMFSQQDRVGNVDFKWYIYWVDTAGKVMDDKLDTELDRSSMHKIEYAKVMSGSPTYLVQRTFINDNDAGGRSEYSNYTQRTKMLEKIRHLSAETYQKLMWLNDDFAAKGQIYQYMANEFKLSSKSIDKIISNTAEAASILRETCRAGKMHFDLVSPKDYLRGERQPKAVNCDNP